MRERKVGFQTTVDGIYHKLYCVFCLNGVFYICAVHTHCMLVELPNHLLCLVLHSFRLELVYSHKYSLLRSLN